MYTITNSGNVSQAGPFSISDDKLGIISPCGSGPLAPGASTSCTALHTITQTDVDNGSITNIAFASSTGVTSLTSLPATATVTANQTKTLSLSKSANATSYNTVGQIISYTLVAKNNSNVTLHSVSISDPKLGTLVCTPTQPATLSPGQSLSCTGSYTIQSTDITAGTLVNNASAAGLGPQNQPVSATASLTINGGTVVTGHVAETGTTCQQFKSGTWGYLDQIYYSVKDGRMNSVNPGVFFYYNKLTAPASGDFSIKVQESSTGSWPMIPTNKEQFILYNTNCVKVANVTVGSNDGQATLKVNGAYTPGATYYFSVKYSPSSLSGSNPGSPAAATYSFQTLLNNQLQITSGATVNIAPKP